MNSFHSYSSETRTWDLKILSLLSAAPSLSYTSMLKVKENSVAGSNKFNSQDLLPDGTKTYNETSSRILPDLLNCHGLKVMRLENLSNQKLFREVRFLHFM